MNKRFAAGFAIVCLGLASAAAAQTVDPRCNDSLIRGTYGFTIEGQKLGAPGSTGPTGPQVGVAMTTFDGEGGLAQIDSVTIGGTLVADFTHPQAIGNYSVNADCTGTFKIEFQDGRPKVTVNFVVSRNGDQIDTVVVAPNVIATRSIGTRRFPGHE